MSTAVMDGIRILEVCDHTFVPAATAILADWGADVIKIEHAVTGDAARGLASSGTVDLGGQVHAIMEHANRGKRSLGLDLKNADGLAVLHRLAATVDVFLVNKPPAVRERLGIDEATIRTHNPTIVYSAGTAWGPRGPEGDRGGYDMTSFWCRSGAAMGTWVPGEPDPPGQPGPAFGDSMGAMTIAGGISAALLARERTGEGQSLEVSLLGTGIITGSLIGGDTIDRSIRCLRRRGTIVNYGGASGLVESISPLALAEAGSVFFTRPHLADYMADAGEIRGRTDTLFELWAQGALKVAIDRTLPLEEAADAHRLIQGRETRGKLLLSV